MPAMNLKFDVKDDGDGAWPDLADKGKKVHWVEDTIEVSALVGGMASGKPSVGLRLNLPDGSVCIAQTSLALFLTAAEALKARYGDPR